VVTGYACLAHPLRLVMRSIAGRMFLMMAGRQPPGAAGDLLPFEIEFRFMKPVFLPL
jgi:hypothetical protein